MIDKTHVLIMTGEISPPDLPRTQHLLRVYHSDPPRDTTKHTISFASIFVTKLPLVICRTSGSVEPPDIYYSSAGSAPQQDHHDRFPKAVLAERSEYSVCFSILESHLSSLLCPLLPPSPHGFQCCLSLLYLLPCFSLHRAG